MSGLTLEDRLTNVQRALDGGRFGAASVLAQVELARQIGRLSELLVQLVQDGKLSLSFELTEAADAPPVIVPRT